MRGIRRVPGVVYTALVPNLRGAERALECARRRAEPRDVGERDAQPGQPAHDARRSRSPRLPEDRAVAAGRVAVNVSLSSASAARWKATCREARCCAGRAASSTLGVRGVTLCDTTGMAYPTQVARAGAGVPRALAGTRSSRCTSTTRAAWGWPTCWPAIEAGADRFDASLGGLGGCPYAPGATGNVVHRGHRPHAGAHGLRHRRGPGAPARRARGACRHSSATTSRARWSRPGAGWTCTRCRPTSSRSALAPKRAEHDNDNEEAPWLASRTSRGMRRRSCCGWVAARGGAKSGDHL